jgi:protein-tyrosine phosphatase
MIDIHCHLLPGIDDGAQDLREAIAMCQLAAADGCSALVATPHLRHELFWNDDRLRIEKVFRDLRQTVAGQIELRLGGEIAVHSESYAELATLPGGQLLTLAGSRYVLLELDRRGLGPDPRELVHELVVVGLFPILAHPERLAWLANDLGLLQELKQEGAYLQVTAMSLTGQFGRPVQDATVKMLDLDLVDFIASDAHRSTRRPPGLKQAFQTVEKLWGAQRATRLLVTHPQAVLSDCELHGLR